MKNIMGLLYFVVVSVGAATLAAYGGICIMNQGWAWAFGYAAMLVVISPIMVLWGYMVMTKEPAQKAIEDKKLESEKVE